MDKQSRFSNGWSDAQWLNVNFFFARENALQTKSQCFPFMLTYPLLPILSRVLNAKQWQLSTMSRTKTGFPNRLSLIIKFNTCHFSNMDCCKWWILLWIGKTEHVDHNFFPLPEFSRNFAKTRVSRYGNMWFWFNQTPNAFKQISISSYRIPVITSSILYAPTQHCQLFAIQMSTSSKLEQELNELVSFLTHLAHDPLFCANVESFPEVDLKQRTLSTSSIRSFSSSPRRIASKEDAVVLLSPLLNELAKVVEGRSCPIHLVYLWLFYLYTSLISQHYSPPIFRKMTATGYHIHHLALFIPSQRKNFPE